MSPFCRERKEGPEKASDSSRALQLVCFRDSAWPPVWEATWVDSAVKKSARVVLGIERALFSRRFQTGPCPCHGSCRRKRQQHLGCVRGKEARVHSAGRESPSVCISFAERRMGALSRHGPSCSMNGTLELTLQSFLKLLIGLAVY